MRWVTRGGSRYCTLSHSRKGDYALFALATRAELESRRARVGASISHSTAGFCPSLLGSWSIFHNCQLSSESEIGTDPLPPVVARPNTRVTVKLTFEAASHTSVRQRAIEHTADT